MQRSVFESAASLVCDWLDRGAGSTWAKRDARLPAHRGHAWDIDLQAPTLPVNYVRLVLPPDFPAGNCELFVDRQYFLRLPHIESDGRVCLGVGSIPNDYDDPVAAVVRALRTLKEMLLAPAEDPRWVEEQFHAERASYWSQYYRQRAREPSSYPVASRTFVDAGGVETFADGRITAYVPAGATGRRFSLQIACVGADPNELASRHGWAVGTMVRGDALFVRVPQEQLWTPKTWPTTFEELSELVGRATDHQASLRGWLRRTGWRDDPTTPAKGSEKANRKQPSKPSPGQRPLLVVLDQGGVMFAYQVFASCIPLLKPPTIEPVAVTRIDPDWCLARDHVRDVLRRRRGRRVLFLGCGSLGSPLATLLVRGGVGHIDLIDFQQMDTENTGRHQLGLADAGRSKAAALAERFMKETPGLQARGFVAEASTWIVKNCQPGAYDLIVDCTAESTVRTFLSHVRCGMFGDAPVIHAWSEPLCSAGHVVFSQSAVPWPADDPADRLVNASDLSAVDTRVVLPACSAGFHPYGAADITLVAAFAAERVLAVLDDLKTPSTIWSWVRSQGFFDSLPLAVATRAIVPPSKSPSDSATLSRSLATILEQRT